MPFIKDKKEKKQKFNDKTCHYLEVKDNSYKNLKNYDVIEYLINSRQKLMKVI